MKKIKIISLSIENFKGTKNRVVNFGSETIISADNGTGKTTIFDSFCWCLFGKDSLGRTNFSLKPIKEDGQSKSGIDSTVVLKLMVDDYEMEFKRVYHEKWTKVKGSTEKKFDKHEMVYSINEVPVKASEYQNKVNEILNEETFKMLTNVYFFTGLKADKQREILFQVLGEVTEEEVISSNEKLSSLTEELTHKTMEEFRKETKARLKRLREEKLSIPNRVDELEKMIFEEDEALVKAKYKKHLQDLAIYDEQIEVSNRIDQEVIKLKNDLKDKESEYQNELLKAKSLITSAISKKEMNLEKMQNEYDTKFNKACADIDKMISDKKLELSKAQNEFDKNKQLAFDKALEPKKEFENRLIQLEYLITDSKNNLETLNRRIEGLRGRLISKKENYIKLKKDYAVLVARKPVIKTNDICPTCGQALPVEEVDKVKVNLIAEFEKNKKSMLKIAKDNLKDLAEIMADIKKNIESCQIEITNTTDNIKLLRCEETELNSKLDTFNPGELNFANRVELQDKIRKLEIEIDGEYEITFEGDVILEKKLAELTLEINTDNSNTVNNCDLEFENKDKLQKEIEELKSEINKERNILNLDSVKEDKNLLMKKIAELKDTQVLIDNNKVINSRISELEAREEELRDQIATLEKTEMIFEEFTKTKTGFIQDKIDKKFKTISFKLFKEYLSGGIEECCEATINGVPYSSANTASQINAGLEIINVLSDYYEVICPIFIDGGESITHPIKGNFQVVKLNVTDLTNQDGSLNLDKVEKFEALNKNVIKQGNIYIEVVE